MRKYIFCELRGVGELHIYLFTEEEADWVRNGGPLPDNIRKNLEKEWMKSGYWTQTQIDDELWEIENGKDDWNVRAMSLGGGLDKDRMFFDVHSYAKWYKNNNVDVVNEFYGDLY